jgi:hypothetical protein
VNSTAPKGDIAVVSLHLASIRGKALERSAVNRELAVNGQQRSMPQKSGGPKTSLTQAGLPPNGRHVLAGPVGAAGAGSEPGSRSHPCPNGAPECMARPARESCFLSVLNRRSDTPKFFPWRSLLTGPRGVRPPHARYSVLSRWHHKETFPIPC